jgi:hypothetical protein
MAEKEELSWFTRQVRDPVVQQFGVLMVFIAGATVAAHYLGSYLTNSIGTSIAVVLMVTLITLPISYVMNRLLYHNRLMRLGGGLVAWVFGPLLWLYITVTTIVAKLGSDTMDGRVAYFGMFPLFDSEPPAEMGSGGWFQAFNKIWLELTNAFRYSIARDLNLVRPLLAPYWQADPAKAVPESIYERAQALAAQATADMGVVENLVDEPRVAKMQELGGARAATRMALGAEFQRVLNSS